jgi:hypothetical protein
MKREERKKNKGNVTNPIVVLSRLDWLQLTNEVGGFFHFSFFTFHLKKHGIGFRERKPRFEERGPGFRERKPCFGERGLGFRERGPRFGERKPRFKERGTGFREHKPRFSKPIKTTVKIKEE